MTIGPTVSIDLAVGVGATGDDFITLDDVVRGELNAFALFDPVGPDLTIDAASSAYEYAIRRGRNDELTDVSTGTLAVSVRNWDASFQFDVDGVDPGRRVRVLLDGVAVYDGLVEDWNFDYTPGGDNTASLAAVDGLGSLARSEFDEWTTTAGDTASDRITDVLDRPEVAWSSALRDLDPGTTPLISETVSWGSNVLSYLQLVARSDGLGSVLVTRDGKVAFRERRSTVFSVAVALADDGTGTPFVAINPQNGAEFLYNRVSITREGGTPNIATDTVSMARYRPRTLSYSGLLMADDSTAFNLAQALVGQYATPSVRFEAVTVNLSAITPDQRVELLTLDLSDVVSIAWTPQNSPTALLMYQAVEGIEIYGSHDNAHFMTLKLSPVTFAESPFILDDADFGVLDTDVLDYY